MQKVHLGKKYIQGKSTSKQKVHPGKIYPEKIHREKIHPGKNTSTNKNQRTGRKNRRQLKKFQTEKSKFAIY